MLGIQGGRHRERIQHTESEDAPAEKDMTLSLQQSDINSSIVCSEDLSDRICIKRSEKKQQHNLAQYSVQFFEYSETA